MQKRRGSLLHAKEEGEPSTFSSLSVLSPERGSEGAREPGSQGARAGGRASGRAGGRAEGIEVGKGGIEEGRDE